MKWIVFYNYMDTLIFHKISPIAIIKSTWQHTLLESNNLYRKWCWITNKSHLVHQGFLILILERKLQPEGNQTFSLTMASANKPYNAIRFRSVHFQGGYQVNGAEPCFW